MKDRQVNRRMCRQSTGIIGIASLFGLFQSLLWGAVSVVGILIYYCVIPVDDYKDKRDFFRVTIVKLYFEGPRCELDGGYMGNFFEEYKNSINLVGKEAMMFLLIAYLILNFVYLFLSFGLYFQRRKMKLYFSLPWSIITLILCTLDVFTTYALVTDAFKLMKYIVDNPQFNGPLFGVITYIPLLLAIFSSRLVVVWLWNFFVGIYIFFGGLCCIAKPETPIKPINVTGETNQQPEKSPNAAEKPEQNPKEPNDNEKDEKGSLSLIGGNYKHVFEAHTGRDRQQSLEGVTRFSGEEETPGEEYNLSWCYAPPSQRVFHPRLEWGATEEGYVTKMAREFDRKLDFEHDLRNFESGQRKVKMARPHVAKPVGVPVPPPLPPIGSCNC